MRARSQLPLPELSVTDIFQGIGNNECQVKEENTNYSKHPKMHTHIIYPEMIQQSDGLVPLPMVLLITYLFSEIRFITTVIWGAKDEKVQGQL